MVYKIHPGHLSGGTTFRVILSSQQQIIAQDCPSDSDGHIPGCNTLKTPETIDSQPCSSYFNHGNRRRFPSKNSPSSSGVQLYHFSDALHRDFVAPQVASVLGPVGPGSLSCVEATNTMDEPKIYRYRYIYIYREISHTYMGFSENRVYSQWNSHLS